MLREFVRKVYTRFFVLPRIHRTYKALSLQETFQNIYRSHAWGEETGEFHSGLGSRGHVVEEYCRIIGQFVQDHGVDSITDLGCGDFYIGGKIVEMTTIRYTGVDVVPELIDHHQSTSESERVRFLCADITKDSLPSADLCLVRQVLQHLSNYEISQALNNLGNFKYVLLTEHVPLNPKSFNRDKPHGPDVRTYYASGVYVDKAPFDLKISQEWHLPLADKTMLRVVLLGDRSLS